MPYNRSRELPFRLPRSLDKLYDARVVFSGILAGEAALCALIIHKVPYTEIDWKAYMHQVELYASGERNYFKLRGGTGPIVYPAGHIYVYHLLSLLTNEGGDIQLAQCIFAVFYLIAQALFILLLLRCRSVRLYALPFIALSKRLHSVYLLRLFNDAVATIPLNAALLSASYRKWRPTAVLYSVALSIKMNILLYAPALGMLIILDAGLTEALSCAAIIVLVQVLLGLPFLLTYPTAYLKRSFDFSRVFIYRWTVNWRFLSPELFRSPYFAMTLLLTHACLLSLLIWRLCQPHGGVASCVGRAWRQPSRPAGLTAIKVEEGAASLCAANLIGIICARSLHYQFYAWYAPQLILLVWKPHWPLPLRVVMLIAIETCWNTYPSTRFSSGLLLACHIVLLSGLLSRPGVLQEQPDQPPHTGNYIQLPSINISSPTV